MTAHPTKPAHASTAIEINRVVKFTVADSLESAPDTLCLVKRAVNEFDLLEQSDEVAWAATVERIALVDPGLNLARLFQGSVMDRYRIRYQVYGLDDAVLQTALGVLQFALYSTAVSSFFDLAHPSSLIVGSGYDTVHDLLNPASPARQTTDARRPPPATASNGVPIVDVSAHVLSIPVIAARNGTTHFWFAGHFRRTAAGGAFPVRASCRAVSGASTDKWETQSASGDADNLAFMSLNGAGADSTSNVDNASVLDAWQFITYEFNGDFTGNNANTCVVTVDGAVQTLTFGGAAMPAALVSVTGTIMYLAQSSTASNAFGGQAGRHWYFGASAMAGVTQGCLTPAARTFFSGFRRPTS